jgi:hypothetical protein
MITAYRRHTKRPKRNLCPDECGNLVFRNEALDAGFVEEIADPEGNDAQLSDLAANFDISRFQTSRNKLRRGSGLEGPANAEPCCGMRLSWLSWQGNRETAAQRRGRDAPV